MQNPDKFSDKVVQAFKNTGTKPVCGLFFKRKSKKLFCCGLSALALDSGCVSRYDNGKDDRALDWARETFGRKFVDGFITGFDGSEKDEFYGNSYRNGYNCGKLSAKKLGLLN